MQFSIIISFLAAAATLVAAAPKPPSIPSGRGTIQLHNGTEVYGCIDSNAFFTTDQSKCLTLTADGTTGIIAWVNSFQNVYLGIPDAYPQPLLFFNNPSQAISWTYAANSKLPGLLYVPAFGQDFQLWSSTVKPAPGTDQALFAGVGIPEGPGSPHSAFFVWESV